MEDEISEDRLEEYKEAFSLFDKDGDGFISSSELGVVMNTLGYRPSHKELNDMLNQVDIDGSGTIDFQEFLLLMRRHSPDYDEEREMRDTFKVFDKNGDGFISPAELKLVLANLGERYTHSEVQAMIREADLNGDGKVDFEEFVRMVKGK